MSLFGTAVSVMICRTLTCDIGLRPLPSRGALVRGWRGRALADGLSRWRRSSRALSSFTFWYFSASASFATWCRRARRERRSMTIVVCLYFPWYFFSIYPCCFCVWTGSLNKWLVALARSAYDDSGLAGGGHVLRSGRWSPTWSRLYMLFLLSHVPDYLPRDC